MFIVAFVGVECVDCGVSVKDTPHVMLVGPP